MSCLTSYCEDCLPDEEVESIGRCRALEELGYHAKQAYYIQCSPCCVDSGIDAKGIHGDALEAEDENSDTNKAKKEVSAQNEIQNQNSKEIDSQPSMRASTVVTCETKEEEEEETEGGKDVADQLKTRQY